MLLERIILCLICVVNNVKGFELEDEELYCPKLALTGACVGAKSATNLSSEAFNSGIGTATTILTNLFLST